MKIIIGMLLTILLFITQLKKWIVTLSIFFEQCINRSDFSRTFPPH